MKDLFEHIHDDASLLKHVLLDDATDEEHIRFEELMQLHPQLKEQMDAMRRDKGLTRAFAPYHTLSADHAYHLFLKRIGYSAPSHRHISAWWYSAAAVAVLIIGMFFYFNIGVRQQNHTLAQQQITIFKPGQTKGCLILPNGTAVAMTQQNVSMMMGNVKVVYHQGMLSYTPVQVNLNDTASARTEMNKFVIPRGGENTVILADGTKVHLNSASELSFPTQFTGMRREVTLRGEAYFDVVKDAEHPFVVNTRYGDITVLGTVFNVNAYDDNDACYTTLVRGKVRFTSYKKENVELLPGQQAVVWHDGALSKRNVDVDEYTSWVDGQYNFHDTSLYDIMKTFGRWYNVEVRYSDPSIKGFTYTGTVKRYDDMNSFLDIFEMTGDLKFTIKGRTVYFYKRE